MPWNDSFSVDVVSIDAEHRALAEAIAELTVLLQRDGGQAPLLAALDGLAARAAEHFTHEERVMRNIGFPDVDRHGRLHQALIGELGELRAEIAASDSLRPVAELERYLNFWLFRHIKTEDTKIRAHIER